jgi:hypothetical protein
MEIDHPDLNAACFGRPVLPAGVLATDGPDKVCAIDKIKQFEAELTASSTDAEERLMALKFILHFVGDLHQPLHSSDNHDRGGNSVKVRHASSLGHGIDLYVAWVRAGAEVLSFPSACFFWWRRRAKTSGKIPWICCSLSRSVLVRGRPSCGFFWSVADCRYGYRY